VFFCGMDGTITVQEQSPTDCDPRLGTQLGGYIVVARVADGAMGRVYEGRHPETKARVAIKVLHGHVVGDNVAVERFKREYETAAELSHPHIVKVLEFGETPDGSWFLTMEYLEGEELGTLLRREGAVARDRVIRILCQAALGLDAAHSYGVIHRDLKPDNIFLCRSPEGDSVRILDFGSVKLQMETGPKLTAFGTTLGSPFYMSPEQAMGKQDVDQRTDVFALAAILFEMLTGRIAFEGNTVAEILMKIVNESPPIASATAPGVPPAVDDVIDKGCRKDKTQRYGTTVELADAASRALGLAGGVDHWAQASTEDIQMAISAAVPPPARPFGFVSQPPPVSAAGGQARSVAPLGAPPPREGQPLMPPARQGVPVLLVLAGLFLFGLVGVAAVVTTWVMLH